MSVPGRPATHRVFIGIKLPAAIASPLAAFGHTNLQPAPAVRWSSANDLHITLKFLGAVQPATLEQVRTSLAAIRSDPFRLSITGAGSFDSAGILFVDVNKSAELLSLQNSVEHAMNATGFPREQRPYTPHITVARRSGRRRTPIQRDLVARLDSFCKRLPVHSFSVEQMILYESLSGHYQALQKYDL